MSPAGGMCWAPWRLRVAARAATRRPNILYVMTDDHTAGQMSCAGNPILRTPNLDRLAREGVRFTNAFCTNSLCAPGRATCLTGTYSHINGVRGNSEAKDAPPEYMRTDVATHPELLHEAGYKTAVIGKWHLNDKPRGFDYSYILPGQGLYEDPDFIENGARTKAKGYVSDVITDRALRWLEDAGAGPWLLVYQHKAPHRPFQPPARLRNLFADIDLPYPKTFDDDYATRQLAAEAKDMRFDISLAGDYPDLPKQLPPVERKRWLYQRFVKDYYRATVGVDENLGRVLDYLDRKKLTDDTLVMYTSDNGFFLGDHGWYDKRFMYEPSLRLPLLVRYPRMVRAGHVEPRMALNIDYAPTLLEYAGVRAPASMQGRSLRPLLERKAPRDWRRSMLYTYYEDSWKLEGKGREAMSDPTFAYFTAHRVSPHRGVRTESHKLIDYYQENGYRELFDLERDPDELRNVHGRAEYAKVQGELEREWGACGSSFMRHSRMLGMPLWRRRAQSRRLRPIRWRRYSSSKAKGRARHRGSRARAGASETLLRAGRAVPDGTKPVGVRTAAGGRQARGARGLEFLQRGFRERVQPDVRDVPHRQSAGRVAGAQSLPRDLEERIHRDVLDRGARQGSRADRETRLPPVRYPDAWSTCSMRRRVYFAVDFADAGCGVASPSSARVRLGHWSTPARSTT